MRNILMTLALTATLGSVAFLTGCSSRVGYSHYDRPAYRHSGYVYQHRGHHHYARPYSPYHYNRPVVVRERRYNDGPSLNINVRD
jgi:hypothetical protein